MTVFALLTICLLCKSLTFNVFLWWPSSSFKSCSIILVNNTKITSQSTLTQYELYETGSSVSNEYWIIRIPEVRGRDAAGGFFFLLLITSVFQSDFIPVNKYRFRRSCNWLCVTSPRCHNRFMKLTMANLISLKNNYYYIITNHICNICSTTVICMSNMRGMSEDTALETASTESPGLCWLKNSGCSPKCWNSNQS